jgi:hypothetical protein
MLFMRMMCLPAVLVPSTEPMKDVAASFVDFKGKLSTLSIPADKLEGGWTGPTGLVVNKLNDLSDVPGDQRSQVAALMAQIPKVGVVGVADFTYRRKSDPMQQVTVRVFVFDNAELCRGWWKSKYEYDGWEKHYTKVSGVPYAAVDSTQMAKRAVVMGNVWMTSGTISKTDEHIKILERYIEAVTGAK